MRNRTTGENLASDGTWGVDAIRRWYRISPVDISGSSYNWSYTTPFDLVPGRYDFEVRAEDDLDLTTSSSNRARLTVYVQVPGDNPPDARLDVTGTQTGVQVLENFLLTGTATDDFGVDAVRVSLRDIDTLRYLQPDGSMAAAQARLDAVLADPGATSTTWSLELDLPTQGDWYDHRLRLRHLRSAGHLDQWRDRPLLRVSGRPATGIRPGTVLTVRGHGVHRSSRGGQRTRRGRPADRSGSGCDPQQRGPVHELERRLHQQQPELANSVPQQPGLAGLELLLHQPGDPRR